MEEEGRTPPLNDSQVLSHSCTDYFLWPPTAPVPGGRLPGAHPPSPATLMPTDGQKTMVPPLLDPFGRPPRLPEAIAAEVAFHTLPVRSSMAEHEDAPFGDSDP